MRWKKLVAVADQSLFWTFSIETEWSATQCQNLLTMSVKTSDKHPLHMFCSEEKALKPSLLQKRAADSAHRGQHTRLKQSRLTEHAWHARQTAKQITAKHYTYYFKLNKQLVDIRHVSQNQQSSNGGEEGTSRSDHVPSFHRGAGVICKLPRSALHQVTCTRGEDGLTLTSHSTS